MKRFTPYLFTLMFGLFGFCFSAAADTVFNFNTLNVGTSSGSGENLTHDGDITTPYVWTLDGITLTVSVADEGVTNPNRFWQTNNGPQLRCYSGSITLESASTMKSIVFNYNGSNFNLTPDNGTLTSGTWNGEATKVVFTVNKNTQLNSITVSADAAEVPTTPEVENIAAFKALEKGTEAKLKLTDAYVTAVSGSNYYVQDATGALYFYNSGLTLEAGKKLNGSVVGKLDIYNSLPEFVKVADTNVDNIAMSDGTATPKALTVAEALDVANASLLAKVTGVDIVKDGNNYYAVQGESRIQIYDQFKVLDAEFQYPEKADIVCIVGMYKGTPQLYPLDANSITESKPVGGAVTYAMTEGETHWSGETLNFEGISLTFGEDGGNDFSAAKADGNVEGFTAYTAGNGENGNKAGGTFYVFNPAVNGNLTVAVVLNANKAFYVVEDGANMAEYDGITVEEKYYGTYSFTVKAGSTYKVYCAGSKLGFYGFIFAPGSADSINTAQTSANADGIVYNLRGQRVDANYKGLVIMNGKKVFQNR